jgi:glycosyltransferase involved in cell wall biosynthesis
MSARVQLLTHEFSPFTGGIGVYVEETARAAAASGAEVTVWAPDYGRSHKDAFEFSVNRIPMRGKQDWLCRWRIARALRTGYPDGRIPGTVVLAEPGPIRLWMYRQLLSLPQPDRLVLVLHGSEVLSLSRNARRCRRFRQLLQATDLIGVVSGPVREMVLGIFPEAADKLVQVPGAVRSCWQSEPVVSYSADGTHREILQVGRVHPRKGQLNLVEAVGLLPANLRERIRVRLVGPVGKPAYARQIRELARDRNLPVDLESALSEEDLKKAYQAAAMLVMPSQPYLNSVEGLGLALLEAQHFGRPVIGTRVGGIPEAIKDNETGLIVPPNDALALANAIQRLLEEPELSASLGRAGGNFVRTEFSWQINVQRLGLV